MPSRGLNRLLWTAILLLLGVLGFKARNNLETIFDRVGKLEIDSVTPAGTISMRWRGKIEAPMKSRIAEAFAQHRGEARTFVLALSSSGGSLTHGAQVVALLREIGETHHLETVVEAGGWCASMCVPVYLQGQRRLADAAARFMFHEVSYNEFWTNEKLAVPESATLSETDKLFRDYFAPAGVSEHWIRKVRTEMTGGRDIWKTGQELADAHAGIVQEIRN